MFCFYYKVLIFNYLYLNNEIKTFDKFKVTENP